MLRTVLCGFLLSSTALFGQVECFFNEEAVEKLPIDRGFSELLLVTPGLDCTPAQAGAAVAVQVNIFTNVPNSNQLLAEGSDETNALVIVGDPQAAVLGENAFPLRRSPVSDAELFAQVLYQADPEGRPTRLHFVNLRVNTTELENGNDPVGVLAFYDGFLVGPPIDIAESTGLDPVALEILTALELGQPGYAGGLVIRETRPGSLRPRTLPGALPNNLQQRAQWGLSQSGFIPTGADGSPDERFAADAGNRIQLSFEGLPDGVEPFSHPIFSDLQVRTALQLALVRDASDQLLGGTSLSGLPADSRVLAEPAPYDPELARQLLIEAGWALDEPDSPTEVGEFVVPFGWSCPEDLAGLEPTEVTVSARLAPWAAGAAPPLSEEKEGGSRNSIPLPGPAYDPNLGPTEGITFDPADCAPREETPPVLSEGGAVNGGSFEGPASPGSILSLFGTGLGPEQPESADEVPLPDELGMAEVELNGVKVPLFFSSEPQINIQVPTEIPESGNLSPEGAAQGSTATLVIIRDGLRSEPVEIPIVPANPGIFTLDSGPGRAIAINPDSSLAHPPGSFPGVTTRPADIGEPLVILATGLGATTPPGITGDDSLDEDGNFVRRDTVLTPTVTIGGVEAELLFSGLSPQFVGVYQLNVIPAAGTPSGDAQPLVIEMNGVASRDDVTIAVAAP